MYPECAGCPKIWLFHKPEVTSSKFQLRRIPSSWVLLDWSTTSQLQHSGVRGEGGGRGQNFNFVESRRVGYHWIDQLHLSYSTRGCEAGGGHCLSFYFTQTFLGEAYASGSCEKTPSFSGPKVEKLYPLLSDIPRKIPLFAPFYSFFFFFFFFKV